MGHGGNFDNVFNPWTGAEFHGVPEPNSSILVLCGLSFLLLKRKKNNES